MRTMLKGGPFWENIAALLSFYTKPANDPLYKKTNISRVFQSKELILQGVTTDLIADDPYQYNLVRLY